MELMCGNFQLERSENLDEYYRVIGVPYFVRLMLCSSKPSLNISKDGDTWSLKTSTLFRTSELRFKLGETYMDKMPSGVELENVTEINRNSMITKSKVPNGQEFERVYDFSEMEMIMETTLSKEKSPISLKESSQAKAMASPKLKSAAETWQSCPSPSLSSDPFPGKRLFLGLTAALDAAAFKMAALPSLALFVLFPSSTETLLFPSRSIYKQSRNEGTDDEILNEYEERGNDPTSEPLLEQLASPIFALPDDVSDVDDVYTLTDL
ncbi:hypothetical protein J437_LFUL006503 [Ladona fulva]|uniref:Lipocalin/cytosolic fatty-acid binding domain-containing protein n=1 Tax=Ladona fulva TaxID=123851 RepID=A0A8K0K0U0_LADFU|nr:hypothetical protein J437_LFUL006503 [Ladona fulva]